MSPAIEDRHRLRTTTVHPSKKSRLGLLMQKPGGRTFRVVRFYLYFGNRDGFLITNLHAAFATEALFRIDRNRLPVFHLVHVDRTNLDALLTSLALVVVNHYFITHLSNPPKFLNTRYPIS